MAFNIEELEEDKKVKLISGLFAGDITHDDVKNDNIGYCEDCKRWENLTVLRTCTFVRAMNKAFREHGAYNNVFLSNHSLDALELYFR